MQSELGGLTDEEVTLLYDIKLADGGVILIDRRERGLAVRLQARGLVELFVPDREEGAGVRLTTSGVDYVARHSRETAAARS